MRKVQFEEPRSKNGACLHCPLDKNIGQGMGMMINPQTVAMTCSSKSYVMSLRQTPFHKEKNVPRWMKNRTLATQQLMAKHILNRIQP